VKITDAAWTGAGATSLFSLATQRIYDNLTREAYNYRAFVYEPIGSVSVIIPAFNEEAHLETNLRSILTQNIILRYKDYFECIVVDNESTDTTAEIALQYCQVISAPRGKLNARDAGIKYAVGKIIVSCDADYWYPPNWLNLLLRHFNDPNVVAVNAPYLPKVNLLQRIGFVWVTYLPIPSRRNRLNGGNSAFIRQAYFDVGGFDLTVNQFKMEGIMTEEEIVFYLKLKQLGEVVFDSQAVGFHLDRGGHGVAGELRLTDSTYHEEIARGERF
jgi:glycosyltransferase involved in cell wall biosynthesis